MEFSTFVRLFNSPVVLATIFNATEPPAYINVMVGSINDLLMRKIEPLSTQQSVLYILNTALVGGENGILKKLKGKGFTVTAENFNYKKYVSDSPLKIDPPPEKNETPSTYTDNFPAITILPSTSGYLNPDEITESRRLSAHRTA